MENSREAIVVPKMIIFTTGNLFDSNAEALVNTVNTVGVMGKGIALMFKDRFPENFRKYEAACRNKDIEVGSVFVTERSDLVDGPRWIVNFPTKKHWRNPSKLEWVEEGLFDLAGFIQEQKVHSIALPPLGSGNGGLDWALVRPVIERVLGRLANVEVTVYEPTSQYQNVSKRAGKQELTPARSIVVELVRRYGALGLDCSLLEIQKLAYFLERQLQRLGLPNVLNLEFRAHRYGPYAPKLGHLLNALDGSYLHCAKRLADAGPMETIWFDPTKQSAISAYLGSEAKTYLPAMEAVSELTDGFESPLGMEALATVDWLMHIDRVQPELKSIRNAIASWPGGDGAAARKEKIFDDRLLELAIARVSTISDDATSAA
jgi:O-acetyl-ADP-ribose deacetylase (regulator of RNase III)